MMKICKVLITLKNGAEIKMTIYQDDLDRIENLCEEKGWKLYKFDETKLVTREQIENMINKLSNDE